MRKLLLFAIPCFAVSVGLALNLSADEKEEHEEHEEHEVIETVMKEAHKGGLLKKILHNKGTQADKDKLVEYYEALAKATPEKGPESSWKKKTQALLDAARKVQKGGPTRLLRKPSNCKKCHSIHKGH